MRKGDTPLAYFPLQGLPVGLAPTSRHLVPLSQEQAGRQPAGNSAAARSSAVASRRHRQS